MRFDIEITGQGADLHAGQLIDRVGIAMGYPFPAGRYMDKAALEYAEKGGEIPLIKTTLDGSDIHLSGAEAGARRLIAEGMPKEAVAAAVLDALTRMVDKWVWRSVRETGCREVLLAGGRKRQRVYVQVSSGQDGKAEPGDRSNFRKTRMEYR